MRIHIVIEDSGDGVLVEAAREFSGVTDNPETSLAFLLSGNIIRDIWRQKQLKTIKVITNDKN